MVSAIADRLPDHLPDLPELPVDVGEVADRLRGLTEAAASTARQAAGTTARQASSTARQARSTARQARSTALQATSSVGQTAGSRKVALPVALVLAALAGVGIFMFLRNRRTTTGVGSAAPTDTYART